MTSAEEPNEGSWYETGDGQIFKVVAFDETEGTIEIQYEDGTIDELDLSSWYGMEPEEVESPEDWKGALDMSAEED